MANQSSADVTIEMRGCVKEFLAYAEAVSKDAFYTLIDEYALDEVRIDKDTDGTEVATINGYGEGRWSYCNNLEQYFAPLHSKESWRSDRDSQVTYGKLVSKLRRDQNAYVKIDYTDIETGAGFIDIGTLFINHESVMDSPQIDSDSHDSTVENLIHYLGKTEYEAIDLIWGDEVAGAWDDYSYNGGKYSVEEFVDEYASDIYDGKDVQEILRLEAAEPEFEKYKKLGGEFDLEDFAENYGDYIREGDFDMESWLEKERVEREEREESEK